MPEVNIEIGSLWADNYHGNKGRTIRVDQADERYVYATVITNSDIAQRELDRGTLFARDVRGRSTRVLRKTFHAGPARTGYSPALEVASDAADA